jgi:hypothetical protein
MARPKRFELLTPRFVVWCSIQLSYGRILVLQYRGVSPPVEAGNLAKSTHPRKPFFRFFFDA